MILRFSEVALDQLKKEGRELMLKKKKVVLRLLRDKIKERSSKLC